MPEVALDVRSVTGGYRPELPILHNVSVKARHGEVTVVIGPNGAGKSTLISAIAGLVSVTSGTITHNGQDITNIRPDRMAVHRISYVPQTDNIFRTLTVGQNLALALRHETDPTGRLEALLVQFPALSGRLDDKAGALSGGQRQFLALAMALATDPQLLLLDEPSAGLSPKAAQEVLEGARDLTKSGVTILLVEQNVNQALRLADHCYILAEGQNQIDGKASDLIGNPAVSEIYLGGRRLKAGA